MEPKTRISIRTEVEKPTGSLLTFCGVGTTAKTGAGRWPRVNRNLLWRRVSPRREALLLCGESQNPIPIAPRQRRESKAKNRKSKAWGGKPKISLCFTPEVPLKRPNLPCRPRFPFPAYLPSLKRRSRAPACFPAAIPLLPLRSPWCCYSSPPHFPHPTRPAVAVYVPAAHSQRLPAIR